MGQVLALGALSLLLWSGVRVILLLQSGVEEIAALQTGELIAIFGTGLRLDGVVIGYVLGPACMLLLLPGWIARRLVAAYSGLAIVLFVFAAVGEILFFGYYGFRPNYLILDHAGDLELLHAVAGRPSIVLELGAASLLAALALAAQRRLARTTGEVLDPYVGHPIGRWLLPVYLALVAGLAARGSFDHRPLNPSAAAVSANRIANELAGSGLLNVAYEAVQRLEHEAVPLASVQETLSWDEAVTRVRRLLQDDGHSLDAPWNPALRWVRASVSGRPRNVVLVVMESFTGRLVGALGGEPALSPELDALAREGVLLTHCYATGERTVQGLEAVVSSFPPLPGVSVIRRPEARRGFATLASVLAARGYDTLFLYGGQGIFDHMRSFFLGNGFQRFIEERDFSRPAFHGSWGVSDGDLFRRANRELQARWERGERFFATLLTVSLHSPWEFPRGEAPPLPRTVHIPPGFEREELQTFLYADHALGEFIREARQLPYSRETLFVFVGDHGVHLRGRALLPSEEYRIPALFLAPPHLKPARIDRVTSQLDVAPTILGIIGGAHRVPFFGHDVLGSTDPDGFAVLIYNKRRYGIRRADRLTVLAETGRRAHYRVRRDGTLLEVRATASHEEDARDGLAVLQVAEQLLRSRRFNIDRPPSGTTALIHARDVIPRVETRSP
ncbi:MAG: LTA synthase family protein [Myxococcota bacterium]